MFNGASKFICVGAARSGTTLFWWWCRQHPDIYVPSIKETNYFSHGVITRNGPGDMECIPDIKSESDLLKETLHAGLVSDLDIYMGLFDGVKKEAVVGEVSPSYLYYAEYAAPRIKDMFPDAKVILFLRNPVWRAISQYELFVKMGREKEEFEYALRLEDKRKKDGWEYAWHYSSLGFYYNAVKIYLELFGRTNVWIGLYEDMKKNQRAFYQEIANFIGVREMSIYFPRVNESASVSKEKFLCVSKWLRVAEKSKITGGTGKINFLLERFVRAKRYSRGIEDLTGRYGSDVSKLSCMVPELKIDRKWR